MRYRRSLAVLLAVALVVLGSTGTALVAVLTGTGSLSPPSPGPGTAPRLPAQPEQPNLIRRQPPVCPTGMVPTVQIQGVSFAPVLKRGSTFGVGRYLITVRGRVANGTTAAIQVQSLEITVDGRRWRRLTAIRSVPPQDVVPIDLLGSYDSPAPHRAVLASQLRWRWQDPGLRPCAEDGLLADD